MSGNAVPIAGEVPELLKLGPEAEAAAALVGLLPAVADAAGVIVKFGCGGLLGPPETGLLLPPPLAQADTDTAVQIAKIVTRNLIFRRPPVD